MIGFFFDLFYMLPLGIAIILSILGLGLGNYIFISATDGVTLSPVAGCIICSFFIIIILALRHSGKKERILIAGIIIVFVVSFFVILGKDNREILYDKYSSVIVIPAISFLSILIGRITEKFIQAKLAVSAILIAGIVYMMVNRMQCPKGTIGCCILVILIYLLELNQQYWNKSGYTDVKNHVARLTPVILVIAITVTLIPAPSEKFEWRMAKNFWKVAVTEYKRIVGSITAGKEEYTYSGFTEDGGVKAGVSDNGREVMLVKSDKNSFDRLYIGGMSYEAFDGKKWSTGFDNELGDREFDFVETKAAIYKFNQGYERNYYKNVNIEVENRLFNTKYIFAPVKTNMYSSNTIFPKYKETESRIVSDKKMKYGDAYNIDYLQINYANPDLILIADSAQALDENEWGEALRKNNLSDVKDLSYEKYIEYRNKIYEKYGGNQELTMEESLNEAQLSDDIKLIVKEVIGSDEEGDFEKLKALADYFQTMKYTHKAEVLPDSIDNSTDFLEYFLLESQSGYCVHYATAFTLLARQLGYPARYVQGYYVERRNKETLVTENRAHAWAEVYFDNFGWIVFEATPGYSLSGGWATLGTVGDKKDIRSNYPVINDIAEDVMMDELPKEKDKNYLYILYVVIPLICAVFFGVLYLLISRIIADKKYLKMNAEAKVRTMIGKNMRILKILGYPLEDIVTLEEYKCGIMENEELAGNTDFLELYEKLLYSDYEVSDSDVKEVEQNYLLLKNSLKAKGVIYRLYIV